MSVFGTSDLARNRAAVNVTGTGPNGQAVCLAGGVFLVDSEGAAVSIASAGNQTATQSPVAPATATATKSQLAGAQYNSAGVTFTNGQQGSLQVNSGGSLLVAMGAGGKPTSVSRIVSAAASTNATSAKASAGDLHFITGYNAAAGLRYLKLYNKASAPTVGTDTPFMTIVLPATTAFALNFPALNFSTGIAYALTTGSADADTGVLTSGDVLGLNVGYL